MPGQSGEHRRGRQENESSGTRINCQAPRGVEGRLKPGQRGQRKGHKTQNQDAGGRAQDLLERSDRLSREAACETSPAGGGGLHRPQHWEQETRQSRRRRKTCDARIARREEVGCYQLNFPVPRGLLFLLSMFKGSRDLDFSLPTPRICDPHSRMPLQTICSVPAHIRKVCAMLTKLRKANNTRLTSGLPRCLIGSESHGEDEEGQRWLQRRGRMLGKRHVLQASEGMGSAPAS